jgi:hypothetical protein
MKQRTFRVDSSQVGVFEKRDKVSLGSLLQGHHSRRLEAQVSLMMTAHDRISLMTMADHMYVCIP